MIKTFVLLVMTACLVVYLYKNPQKTEPNITVKTRCEDGLVCFQDRYTNKGIYCLRDSDLVAKYCGEKK